MAHFVSQYGLGVVAGLVVPGETAFIVAASYYVGEAVVRDAAVGIGAVAALVLALAAVHLVRRRRPERA